MSDSVLIDPTITRQPARELEDGCHFCTEEQNKERDHREMILSIESEYYIMSFCAYHEGMLLMRLLNNYHRRMRRKSSSKKRRGGAGFLEDIPKVDLCELCGDVLIEDPNYNAYDWGEGDDDIVFSDEAIEANAKLTHDGVNREEEPIE